MKKLWPQVKLGELLVPVSRPEPVDPFRTYNILGAHWYAQGLYTKDVLAGSEIQAARVFRVEKGDFVYNRLFGWKGSFALASDENGACYVSNEFPCFEVRSDRLEGRYLWLYFSRNAAWDAALSLSSGGTPTSRNRLKEEQFLSLEIPLPPLPEQRRIVARLDQLSTRIEEARTMRRSSADTLHALRAAALTVALSGHPVSGTLQDVLLDKPRNGWSVRCDGSADGVAVLSLSSVTGFQYQRSAHKRTSEPTDPHAHYWLKPGELLITRSNTPELVGHAAIYDGTPAPCIYPDLMMRLSVNHEHADIRFVHLWLMTTAVRDYVRTRAKGTSPTMKKVSQGIVMGIPFPSHLALTQQKKIVEHIDGLQAKAGTLKKLQDESSKELDALMPSILSKAFAGEL